MGEMKPFLVIWVGQLVSALGSGLTGFAVPVVVFQQTGSAEQFGLLMFAWMVPSLLLSPVAGALVDRWDRRTVLVAADAGSGVMILLLAWLVLSGRFELWFLLLATAIGSVISAFQEPAFAASVAALVPKRHFARAMGMVQMMMPVSMIVAPLLGGALVVTIGLGGIMVIDAATFVIAVGTLAVIAIPRPAREILPPAGNWRAAARRFGGEVTEGLRFLRARPGLFGILVVFAVTNFFEGFVNPLLAPMVLSFARATEFATVQAVAGAGAVLGGVAMGIWGGPRNRVAGIILSLVAGGVAVAAMGAAPSVPLIVAAAFVWTLATPPLLACSAAIWMSKTPQALLGRVFAVRRMVTMSMMPLAVLIAGPLADRVFEPLLAPGGALAGSAGALVGVGPGRGMALMLVLLGGLTVVVSAAAWLVPAIRHVERDVADAPHPQSPAPAPARGALEPVAAG